MVTEINMMFAEGLTKVYRDRIVVDDVKFNIRGGEIFGLFGPNGSGKSTILRMLTGITRPTKGRIGFTKDGKNVSVLNDPMAIREHASILTETPALYEGMELFHYLHFYGRLSRIPEDDLSKRVLEAVSIVGMEDHLYRPLRQMSMGERQRVELARVLLKDSPIIFLDEPFNGIDITTRREIRDYLKNVWLNEDRCVFFTSHNLLESEHFVDRFAFIYQGKIIASGDEDELKKRFATKKFIIHFQDKPSAREAFQTLIPTGILQEGEVVGHRIFLTLSATDDLNLIIQTLVGNNITFQEIHPVGTIEDIFIELVDSKKQREGLDYLDEDLPFEKDQPDETGTGIMDEVESTSGSEPSPIPPVEMPDIHLPEPSDPGAIDDMKDEAISDMKDQTMDEMKDELIDEMKDETMDESTDEAIDEMKDGTMEEIKDQTVDKPTDESMARSLVRPIGESLDETLEETKEKGTHERDEEDEKEVVN